MATTTDKTDTTTKYGYNWWLGQLDQDEKRLKNDWWRFADLIVKKFKGKKGQDVQSNTPMYLYNLFWANVGVMKAALYAKPPKPMVKRVWQDQNDNIGRVAALIIQRCLAYDFLKNCSPMDEAIKKAVEDRLVPGLGCVWMRYEAQTSKKSIQMEDGSSQEEEHVEQEDAPCDYVHWRDLVYPSARVWDEVWYIAKKAYLTPDEFKKKFGTDPAKTDQTETSDQDKALPKNFAKGKITVYEIWCKKSNKIYWLSREVKGVITNKNDFLGLDEFYPCPEFLMATHTTDDYLPRSDYTMAKDQYEQLDDLNTRIVILEKALRVVGVYDMKNDEIKRMLTDAHENDMIPVEKWAVLGEAGGLKGVVDWFPIEMIATVLEKLTVQKQAKVDEIYQLTGISDIMRGTTNPRETLGAQELKSQYSSVRLQWTQTDVSVFVRRALIIKAQIICDHFQDETILRLSNIMQTPDAQYAQPALQLLRESEISEYRIDINEEGLALPDYNQEKQTRIDFLTTIGQFLSQAAPITVAIPGAMPYLVQMIRWVAAGLRGSDEIQGVLDQAAQAALNMPPQQQPQQPPDSAPQVAQINQQGQQKLALVRGQMDMQKVQKEKDLELRNIVVKGRVDAGIDSQHAQQTHVHDLIQAGQEHGHNLTEQQLVAANTQDQAVQAAMTQFARDRLQFGKEERLSDKQQAYDLQKTKAQAQRGEAS
jgi:hypothetical protein